MEIRAYDWKAKVGRNVRALRRSRGKTQKEIADLARITPTYLSGVERGFRNPSLIILIRIATALQVPPWLLLSAGGQAAVQAFAGELAEANSNAEPPPHAHAAPHK